MPISKKLQLCGLKEYIDEDYDPNSTTYTVLYKDQQMMIDASYDPDAIYIDIYKRKKLKTFHHLIIQLLGRYKHRHIVIKNQAPYHRHNKLPNLYFELRRTLPTNISVARSPHDERMIYIFRYPPMCKPIGTIRNCEMTFMKFDKAIFTTKHTQIITKHNNDIYIHFEPPLLYANAQLSSDIATYITTPIATCGARKSFESPRWNKLEQCTKYREKHHIIHTPNTHIARRKMMISLDPMKNTKCEYYQPEYTQYQTYARQILFHLNHQAKTIQKAWRRCISDPTYKVCQRRLTNEFTLESQALPRGAP